MGLGEIEADAAFLDDQPLEPVRLGREQILERFGRRAFQRLPGVLSHIAAS